MSDPPPGGRLAWVAMPPTMPCSRSLRVLHDHRDRAVAATTIVRWPRCVRRQCVVAANLGGPRMLQLSREDAAQMLARPLPAPFEILGA